MSMNQQTKIPETFQMTNIQFIVPLDNMIAVLGTGGMTIGNYSREVINLPHNNFVCIITIPHNDFFYTVMPLKKRFVHQGVHYNILTTKRHMCSSESWSTELPEDIMKSLLVRPDLLNGANAFSKLLVHFSDESTLKYTTGFYSSTSSPRGVIDGVTVVYSINYARSIDSDAYQCFGSTPINCPVQGILSPLQDGLCFISDGASLYIPYDAVTDSKHVPEHSSGVNHSDSFDDLMIFISPDGNDKICFRFPSCESKELTDFLVMKMAWNNNVGHVEQTGQELSNDDKYETDIAELAPKQRPKKRYRNAARACPKSAPAKRLHQIGASVEIESVEKSLPCSEPALLTTSITHPHATETFTHGDNVNTVIVKQSEESKHTLVNDELSVLRQVCNGQYDLRETPRQQTQLAQRVKYYEDLLNDISHIGSMLTIAVHKQEHYEDESLEDRLSSGKENERQHTGHIMKQQIHQIPKRHSGKNEMIATGKKSKPMKTGDKPKHGQCQTRRRVVKKKIAKNQSDKKKIKVEDNMKGNDTHSPTTNNERSVVGGDLGWRQKLHHTVAAERNKAIGNKIKEWKMTGYSWDKFSEDKRQQMREISSTHVHYGYKPDSYRVKNSVYQYVYTHSNVNKTQNAKDLGKEDFE